MKRLGLLASLLVASNPALADEGMWTLNGFPTAEVKKRYGFEATPEWLKKVQLSSVRLAGGCSGSLVSGDGLVMTNHHCVHGCIEQLSTKRKDLVKRGFLAKTPKQEKVCPAMEINQLVEITDVTKKIEAATAKLTGEAYTKARKKAMADIEKGCASSDKLRCDVVSLYNGGRYDLYKYRRFQDVRLAFAPEIDIAFFGGDPDNFNFPRYVLDAAFVRLWDGDAPAETPNHFGWSDAGAKNEELVFVSGNPGSTRRLKTIAQLEYLRDDYLPDRLIRLAEWRGLLTEFSRKGKENARIAKTPLFYAENSLKALKGRREALVDKAFFASKVAQEKELRAKVDSNPQLKEYRGAWGAIEGALARYRQIRPQLAYKEQAVGYRSRLFSIARTLVRHAAEVDKPNGERLRAYTDGKLPATKARLFSKAPIHPKLEIRRMTQWLTLLREELGPDDPFVKKVLGNKSPEQLARKLVRGSKLKRVKLRRRLFKGGQEAIDRAKDPMVRFAAAIDAEGRAIYKTYEDEISSVIKRSEEQIAKARFAVFGTSIYPDATFSARLSYGQVKGFPHRGQEVTPFTKVGGAYTRATGSPPFALPRRWLRKKGKLDLETPMNFVTTNDIIGGNSGSPVINAKAEIVGLIFDGNIYSLGGDYGFDARVNRAVAVHSDLITHTLDKLYGAKRLLRELKPTAKAKGKMKPKAKAKAAPEDEDEDDLDLMDDFDEEEDDQEETTSKPKAKGKMKPKGKMKAKAKAKGKMKAKAKGK